MVIPRPTQAQTVQRCPAKHVIRNVVYKDHRSATPRTTSILASRFDAIYRLTDGLCRAEVPNDVYESVFQRLDR